MQKYKKITFNIDEKTAELINKIQEILIQKSGFQMNVTKTDAIKYCIWHNDLNKSNK